MTNLVIANAQIKFKNPDSMPTFEEDIYLDDHDIKDRSTYPDSLKVKYLMDTSTSAKVPCASCGEKKYSPSKVKVKVLGIWDINDYFQIEIKTQDEKKIYSRIISIMREMLYHDQYLCDHCLDQFGNDSK